MTKAELIERIIDCMIDPWTDDPEDYLYATPIDKYGAVDLMAQIREDEDSADLEPDECLPEEATPELVMEAYNCLICARKFEARVSRLAEFLTDNNCVCEYSNYYDGEDFVDVFPVDWLTDTDGLHFLDKASPMEIMQIGINSRVTFNPNHEFCWYDADKKILHSTDNPFRDGVIDAEAFARSILLDVESADYIINDIMTDDEAKRVLGCTKEEFFNE